MELLSYQDYTNTLLGYHMYLRSGILEEDRCPRCKKFQQDKLFKIYGYCWFSPDSECKCPKRGKTYFVAVQIKARGNPISTKPAQTIYEVCIWSLERPFRVECTAELLLTEKPIFQFMLDYADRDVDLDYSNQGIIIQFYEYLTDITESNYSFRGVVSRKSYLQDYLERIEKIKNGVPRPIQQDEENGHLERRKKGHSHIK
tara:strand:- start:157 stop:759 length:603 start_codon:yes stop_codon:yes gene_type:complete